MSKDILNIVIIIGVFQGIITSILLFFKSSKKKSDYLLILLLIAFSITGINIIITKQVGLKFLPVKFPPLSLELFMPPLFYLYVLSITKNIKEIGAKYFSMFVPGILFYLTLNTLFIILQQKITDNYLETYYYARAIEDTIIPVFWLIILYLSFINLKKYKNLIKNTSSNTSWPLYNFIKYAIILLFIGNSIYAINVSLDFSINFCHISYMHWKIYYIILSVVIYYVGFMGYKTSDENIPISLPQNTLVSKNNPDITESEIENYKEKIISVVEKEKIFFNPELDLQTLSSKLEISPQLLSHLINKIFKTNFRNFINNYRIEEVKKNLLSEKYKEYSIIGIALECGFNSEPSFYRIFKNKTGISPLDYKKKYSQNIK